MVITTNNFLVAKVVLYREPFKKTTGAILRGFTMTHGQKKQERIRVLRYFN